MNAAQNAHDKADGRYAASKTLRDFDAVLKRLDKAVEKNDLPEQVAKNLRETLFEKLVEGIGGKKPEPKAPVPTKTT